MKQSNSNDSWFGPLFLIAGYALLALSFLDIIDLFVPPSFTNPAWEFRTASSLVERAPVPLLGLILVLVGVKNIRIFRLLSTSCLVVGLLFILLVPLIINSAWRIDRQNEQQFAQQFSQQTSQVQQLRQQLSQANTDQQIREALTRLTPQSNPQEIRNPQQVKNQILTKVAAAEQQLKAQQATQEGNRLNLLKNAVKIVLGALVSGTVFLTIWRKTIKVLKMSK